VKIGMSLTSRYLVDQGSAQIMENLGEEVRLMAELGSTPSPWATTT